MRPLFFALVAVLLSGCASTQKTTEAPDVGVEAVKVGEAADAVKANSEQTIKHVDKWNARTPGPEAGKVKILQRDNISQAGKLQDVQKALDFAQTDIDALEQENVELKESLESKNSWLWGMGIAAGFLGLLLAVPLFIWVNPKAGIVAGIAGASTLVLSLVLQRWAPVIAFIGGLLIIGAMVVGVIYLVVKYRRWIVELVRSGEVMKKHMGDTWSDEQIQTDVGTPQSPELQDHVKAVRDVDRLRAKPSHQ